MQFQLLRDRDDRHPARPDALHRLVLERVGNTRRFRSHPSAEDHGGGGLTWGWFIVRHSAMEFDEDKIDEAVLALMSLTLHDGQRAWKGFDWDALDRLHRKGFISNPVGKAKSVVQTDEGLQRSEELLAALFGKPGAN